MNKEKSLVVRKNRNRGSDFESVFEGRRFSDRLRARRIQRNNDIDEMGVNHDLNPITNNSNRSNNRSNPLIELLSDTGSDVTSENELINEERNESIAEDITEEIPENNSEDNGENNGEELSVSIDVNESVNGMDNNNRFQRDLIRPLDLDIHPSVRNENIAATITESNDHIDRATNFLELAQIQNRWILFGLGTGFVVVTGLSYWIGYRMGYRAGQSSVLVRENLGRVGQRTKSLKIIWNLLIDRLKK